MKRVQKYKKNTVIRLFGVLLLKDSHIFLICFIFAQQFMPNNMLSNTLYDISLICSMAVTTTLGLVLLCAGNAKVSSSPYLKKLKLAFSIVLLLAGGTAALQWSMQLSETNPLAESALNITLVTTGFLVFYLAFLPLAGPIKLTRVRQFIIFTTFLAYMTLLWTSITRFPTLSRIILFISIGLFFFELVRVNIVFFYNYKTLSDSHPEPDSEEGRRWTVLNMSVNIIIVLSVSAALYMLSVVLAQQYKAIYHLAMLLVWGYLFVSFINIIINFNTLLINNIDKSTQLNEQPNQSTIYGDLSPKVKQWVEKGGYRMSGITMTQAAQEMSTNIVYLSQYINTHYGCNFKSWIARLRINYAKQLLVTTSITIDMVAARAGFSNKAQFITAFKAHEGCTPGVWRQQKQQ